MSLLGINTSLLSTPWSLCNKLLPTFRDIFQPFPLHKGKGLAIGQATRSGNSGMSFKTHPSPFVLKYRAINIKYATCGERKLNVS